MMYTIKSKKNGTVWDTVNDRPLAKFVGGLFQTEDKELAEKLKTMGYTVEEPPKK